MIKGSQFNNNNNDNDHASSFLINQASIKIKSQLDAFRQTQRRNSITGQTVATMDSKEFT